MNEVQVLHTLFECKMPSRANLLTGCRICLVPGDMMSNHFYDLYCPQPNRGELESLILLYEFEQITKNGGICVTVISFSPLGFMG